MAEDEEKKERILDKKDRVEILMEDMIHDFKAVKEGHGILLTEIKESNRKSEERDKNLEDMIKFNSKVLHEKIDNVEVKLSEKIDNVDIRLTNVEQKVDVIDNRLIKVEQKVDVLSERQEKTDKKIDKLDEKMTKRQDEIEGKVDVVHQKVFGH